MKTFGQSFKTNIFDTNHQNFNDKALELFLYQSSENEVYKSYLSHLKVNPKSVKSIHQIPFLPIEFFKSHRVITGKKKITHVFQSSGTTGQVRSKHYVSDINFYYEVSEAIFEQFFEKLSECTFYCLLPSYAERDDSSLIYMVNHFISKSKNSNSGFYLNNYEELVNHLKESNETKNTFLFGVSFALLDLAEKQSLDLSKVQILETGGMKGRRKEMIREELHSVLYKSFKTHLIGSEYGMTELLSQAYSKGNGKFTSPPWLRVLNREVDDPFAVYESRTKRGCINVIDLANIDSCAFIETKDLGFFYEDLSFEVLGRMDNSDIRGCNLMFY